MYVLPHWDRSCRSNYLTQSQYTDTQPTSPSADPITPGTWQGSHWSAKFFKSLVRLDPEKSQCKWESIPRSAVHEVDTWTTGPSQNKRRRPPQYKQTDQYHQHWHVYSLPHTDRGHLSTNRQINIISTDMSTACLTQTEATSVQTDRSISSALTCLQPASHRQRPPQYRQTDQYHQHWHVYSLPHTDRGHLSTNRQINIISADMSTACLTQTEATSVQTNRSISSALPGLQPASHRQRPPQYKQTDQYHQCCHVCSLPHTTWRPNHQQPWGGQGGWNMQKEIHEGSEGGREQKGGEPGESCLPYLWVCRSCDVSWPAVCTAAAGRDRPCSPREKSARGFWKCNQTGLGLEGWRGPWQTRRPHDCRPGGTDETGCAEWRRETDARPHWGQVPRTQFSHKHGG